MAKAVKSLTETLERLSNDAENRNMIISKIVEILDNEISDDTPCGGDWDIDNCENCNDYWECSDNLKQSNRMSELRKLLEV